MKKEKKRKHKATTLRHLLLSGSSGTEQLHRAFWVLLCRFKEIEAHENNYTGKNQGKLREFLE